MILFKTCLGLPSIPVVLIQEYWVKPNTYRYFSIFSKVALAGFERYIFTSLLFYVFPVQKAILQFSVLFQMLIQSNLDVLGSAVEVFFLLLSS